MESRRYSPAVAGVGLPARPGGGSDSASLLVPFGDCGGSSLLRRAVEGWVPLRGMVAGAGGEPGASQPAGPQNRTGTCPAGARVGWVQPPPHATRGSTPSASFREPRLKNAARRQRVLGKEGTKNPSAKKAGFVLSPNKWENLDVPGYQTRIELFKFFLFS